jgi:hypothetical protein
MILVDVNVLVCAFRKEAPLHALTHRWLKKEISKPQPFGLSELVGSAFLRIVTHPKVFSLPSPVGKALEFWDALAQRPDCVPVRGGDRHWEIFSRLCRDGGAKGNLIPDAYLAALAIESGCEWITFDRGFARFPGLQWRAPDLEAGGKPTASR